MPGPEAGRTAKKRKRADDPQTIERNTSKNQPLPPESTSLLGPHQTILAQLSAKYHVLPASVISSTQIRKRVTHIVTHLLEPSTEKPRIALLHARTADVCKLITVVEQCKRLLADEGKPWYQYNQLFDQPERREKIEIVEETVVEKADADKEESSSANDDDFEVMESRFEKAVIPPPSRNLIKSMRVFLSTTQIQELKASGATLQASDDNKT